MIRTLTESDIPAVLRVQKEAYRPELIECADTFLHKMRLFPQGALGYFNGEMGAYIFVHPWLKESVVPLDHALAKLPAHPDCIYIHDLAVGNAARGKGVGKLLMDRVFAIGEEMGIHTYSLVAVQSSEPFWRRFGFTPVEGFEYVENVEASRMTLERGSR